MNEVKWNKIARAEINQDFINVETYSTHGLSMADPKAKEYILEPDASDEVLGKAVVNTLQESRYLSLEEATELRINGAQNYQSWLNKTMTRFGYKTKRAMFKDMKSCGMEIRDDVIVIRPSHHERLEGWSGDNFTEEDYVRVPVDAPPAEIGAALRLAFSRCTSKKF